MREVSITPILQMMRQKLDELRQVRTSKEHNKVLADSFFAVYRYSVPVFRLTRGGGSPSAD